MQVSMYNAVKVKVIEWLAGSKLLWIPEDYSWVDLWLFYLQATQSRNHLIFPASGPRTPLFPRKLATKRAHQLTWPGPFPRPFLLPQTMFSRGARRLIVLLLSIFTFFLFRDIRNHGVEQEHATDAEDQQSSPGRERGQDFKCCYLTDYSQISSRNLQIPS
jgi:hypothetical protein